MKIWDNSIRDKPIFDGSPIVGARLKLGEVSGDPYHHEPFRRALSYQAYISYLKFKHVEDHQELVEFGTEYVIQNRLMKQSVLRDIEEELENEL